MAQELNSATLVFAFCCCLTMVELAELSPSNLYPEGDIKHCLAIFGKDAERFEVLPGIGWDNLENKDRGILVTYNYSRCKTTYDGQFIIPDNIFTVPLKTSDLEIFGEMFKHWTDYTSTTASAININAGLNHDSFSISGSFSREFESIKKHQTTDKSITTRVQAKYVRYTAKLQPDSQLSPAFRQRLKNIAFYIQKNMTRMASYESQILVRDFGTHILSSMDAGAIVTQVDEIKSTFAKNQDKDSSKIVAAASASFQSTFKLDFNYQTSTSSDFIKQYEGNRTHSVIKAIGGPMFKPNNFTLNDWVSQVKTNLVAVNRYGFPIYELITLFNLPELPPAILYSVVEHVKKAVEMYYEFNMYRGCTDIDSPNFSFMANVDDGTCSYRTSNYTYGGIYQTCTQIGQLNEDLCASLLQKNPLTGDFTCPEGFKSIFLLDGQISSAELRTRCTSCGFLGLKTCCSNYHVYGTATFKAHWCVRHGSYAKHDGFLFGGIYTDASDNPLTQTRECPIYFYPLRMGTNMKVCVSDDFELGFRYSVPFAGFFSCKTGNPLAIIEDSSQNETDYLYSYLISGDPSRWPHTCPTGYSMHLAAVEKDTCEINYCVKARAFSYKGLPPIQKPPYFELPNNAFEDGDRFAKLYEVGDDRKTWIALTPQTLNETAKSQLSSAAVLTFEMKTILAMAWLVHLISARGF